MLFNSIEFAFFLPIVFLLYWFIFQKNLKLQNLFIVVVSYIFYGWWDWRFLFLIAFTSACSFGAGLLIDKYRETPGKAKAVNVVNIVLNLLILGVFKYYDFFVTSFADAFLGGKTDGLLLNVILPVGISFYTFQALSYSIDVYRGKLEPTRDIIQFFAFVSFFPQLVAGPIERATNLLPQFGAARTFKYEEGVDGLRQVLWGLFKKMVVADNCAIYVDQVFSTYQTQSGSTLLYFSRDIAEFWRRWHISLTTWFRDYVYIPLGGSRCSKAKIVRNTFVIFLLSGFWHGANWTFIVWGAYHALLFLPLILMGKNRKYRNTVAEGHLLPSIKETGQMILTFFLVTVGWIIFRAENIGQAWTIVSRICDSSLFTMPFLYVGTKKAALFILLMLFVEWLFKDRRFAWDFAGIPKWIPIVASYSLILVILEFSAHSQSFIYFQF